MKHKKILFLALNILLFQPKAYAMNMPLVDIGISVNSIDYRIKQTRLNTKKPNALQRLDFSIHKTTTLEKGIKIAGISLAVLGSLIILIKLYVWYENAQAQKKIDHLHRIITKNSWNKEDPELLKELYFFVCELRDHPECIEIKDELTRVLSYFSASTRKPTSKEKEHSDDTKNFVNNMMLNYFLWKDWL